MEQLHSRVALVSFRCYLGSLDSGSETPQELERLLGPKENEKEKDLKIVVAR